MRQVGLRTHVDDEHGLVRMLDGVLVGQMVRERGLARSASVVPNGIATL